MLRTFPGPQTTPQTSTPNLPSRSKDLNSYTILVKSRGFFSRDV
jgi:hypothetical protein